MKKSCRMCFFCLRKCGQNPGRGKPEKVSNEVDILMQTFGYNLYILFLIFKAIDISRQSDWYSIKVHEFFINSMWKLNNLLKNGLKRHI